MSRRGGRGVVQASDSCMGSRPSLLKTHSSFSHLRRACPTFPTPRLTCDFYDLPFGVTFPSLWISVFSCSIVVLDHGCGSVSCLVQRDHSSWYCTPLQQQNYCFFKLVLLLNIVALA